MRRSLSLALLGLLAGSLPLGAAPLPAAKTGLSQVPASAPLVIQMRGLDGTVDRLAAFLKAAVPDHADLAVLLLKQGVENGFDGRSLKALSKDGPHFVAFLEMPKPNQEGPPKMAVVVSTTDNQKFLDALLKDGEKKALKKEDGYKSTVVENTGEPLFIVERDGFVLFTPRKDVAKELVQKGAGLDSRISEPLMDKLLAFDVGAYLSMDVLNKDYAEQIKAAKKEILDNLDNQGAGAGLDKAQLALAKKVIAGLAQSVEDSQGIVAGLEFRPTAVAMHFQSELRPGSPTAKLLGDAPASKFEDLGKLPAGQMFYVGGEMNPAVFEALKPVLFPAVGEPDSKEAKAAAAAVEKIVAGKPTAMAFSSTVPTAGLQIWRAADPKAMLAGQVDLFKALAAGANFGGMALKEAAAVKADAQKHRGFTFTQVVIKPDLDKLGDQFGPELPEDFKKAMLDGMKKAIGDEIQLFTGADDKSVYQVTAKDWAGAQKILDAYLDGKDTVRVLDGYGQIRKDLPAQATVVGLVDFPTYLAQVVEMVKPALGGLPIMLPAKFPAEAPKGSAGFLAMAASLGKDRASADFVISAECVLVTYKRFVAPFLRGAAAE